MEETKVTGTKQSLEANFGEDEKRAYIKKNVTGAKIWYNNKIEAYKFEALAKEGNMSVEGMAARVRSFGMKCGKSVRMEMVYYISHDMFTAPFEDEQFDTKTECLRAIRKHLKENPIIEFDKHFNNRENTISEYNISAHGSYEEMWGG